MSEPTKRPLFGLQWEQFGGDEKHPAGSRLPVPGGWLVSSYPCGESEPPVYVPDPGKRWDLDGPSRDSPTREIITEVQPLDEEQERADRTRDYDDGDTSHMLHPPKPLNPYA